MECDLTADCTTKTALATLGGLGGQTDETNTQADTHWRSRGILKTKYPEADTGNKESRHDLNFHKLQ